MKEQLSTVVCIMLITGSEKQLLCHFTYSETWLCWLLFNSSLRWRKICFGHSNGSNWSQGGAFHHNSCSNNSDGKRLLDAQSAGFSVPLTWFHLSGGMCSMIEHTLLPTGLLPSWEESVQWLHHTAQRTTMRWHHYVVLVCQAGTSPAHLQKVKG